MRKSAVYGELPFIFSGSSTLFALLDNKQSGGLYSYGLMSQWLRSDEAENEESHHAERENIWL